MTIKTIFKTYLVTFEIIKKRHRKEIYIFNLFPFIKNIKNLKTNNILQKNPHHLLTYFSSGPTHHHHQP
jgi:hypothetical protein